MQISQPTPHHSPPSPTQQLDRPVVFFDGECVMCNGFVDLLIKIDPSSTVKVAPLQGETARQYLPPLPQNRGDWSIYYFDRHNLYSQSDAFIQVCRRLGGIWAVLGLVSIIPRPVRDFVYRIIASNRYRMFGRRSTCRMPSEREKMRFLP